MLGCVSPFDLDDWVMKTNYLNAGFLIHIDRETSFTCFYYWCESNCAILIETLMSVTLFSYIDENLKLFYWVTWGHYHVSTYHWKIEVMRLPRDDYRSLFAHYRLTVSSCSLVQTIADTLKMCSHGLWMFVYLCPCDRACQLSLDPRNVST